MKNVAIFYSSKFGQTKSIAYFMLDKLIKKDIAVQIYDLSKPGLEPEIAANIEGVILAAPVYRGKFNPVFLNWVRANSIELQKRRTAFCSVSLNAADHRPQSRTADDDLLRLFIESTGLRTDFVASFAGAVKYLEYLWPIKFLLRWISRSAQGPVDTRYNYELTDWSQVESFIDHFVANDSLCSYSTAVRLPRDFAMSNIKFSKRGSLASEQHQLP